MNYEIWENGADALRVKADGYTLCVLRRGGWRLVAVVPKGSTNGDAQAQFDTWLAEQDPPVGSTERTIAHIRWWKEKEEKRKGPVDCTCGQHPGPMFLAEMVAALHRPARQGGELEFEVEVDDAKKELKLKVSLPPHIGAALIGTSENVENGERDAERKGTRGKT